jgi:hypothetical protein
VVCKVAVFGLGMCGGQRTKGQRGLKRTQMLIGITETDTTV